MQISDPWTFFLVGAAGACLGVFYYGGLWWTVNRVLLEGKPTYWFIGGLLLRLGVTMSGFYLVGAGQWARLLACLAGFILARMVVTHWAPFGDRGRSRYKEEVDHASQS